MLELILLCVVTAKQPSNPPPPPLPAKIVAVLPPKEQKIVKDADCRDEFPEKKSSGMLKTTKKAIGKLVKRQYNRRGIRNSKTAFENDA